MHIDLDRMLAVYDEGRFLDLYEETRDAWSRPELVPTLSPEELIHAGRLASRLGGYEIQRALFREAHARAPALPLVRYFTHNTDRSRPSLLALLREAERCPELDSGVPWLTASWYCNGAVLWSSVRDFPRAHELLKRARACRSNRGWVEACASTVLIREGRWPDALTAAEEAVRLAPRSPAAVASLGEALSRLGRVGEAVKRLVPLAESGQSFEVLVLALWYVGMLAERRPSEEHSRLAEVATRLTERLPAHAPLARREARSRIAWCRLDAARLRGDREAMGRYASEVNSPFFRTVAENLARAKAPPAHHTRYRPVLQRHDTCLPASVAAVGGAFDRDIDADALAEALTYGGTPEWRVVDWLEAQGYETCSFLVDLDTVTRLLAAGLPFVLFQHGIRVSHAVAVVGIDPAAGVLILHDPSHSRLGEVLLDHLQAEEAPLGPTALAFVPKDRASELDVIPRASRRKASALVDFSRIHMTRGVGELTPVVEELERDLPDDDYPRYLRSLDLTLSGRLHEGIAIHEDLLKRYPNCPQLLTAFLDSLNRTRDTARNLRVLGSIVDRGGVPGIQAHEPWRYPPATCVAQYADHLGNDAENWGRAERLLEKTIRRAPMEGDLYHILADVLDRQGRSEASVLPHRIASMLAESNAHYARATSDACRGVGREEDGIRYLRLRAERLGGRAGGSDAWVTLIDALEDYGQPDAASAEARRAQAALPDDGLLLGYLVGYWCRRGDWQEAEAALAAVEASGRRAHHLAAASRFHAGAGRWDDALQAAESWVLEAPQDMAARRMVVHALERCAGRTAAFERTRRWKEERPADEEIEDLYLEHLRSSEQDEAYELAVRARLERNPSDAWAWQELGHHLLNRLESGSGEDGVNLEREVDAAIERSVVLGPDAPATRTLQARRAEIAGRIEEAVDLLLQSLEHGPEYGWAVGRAWELAGALSPERQHDVRERLEATILQSVGPLHGARSLAFGIADRFGVEEAEATVLGWRERVPDDPEVIEALADLWIERGKGRTDAERARVLLKNAVRHYPSHDDLRLSLAAAHQELLEEDDAIEVLQGLVRRNPLHVFARAKLARLLARKGDVDDAVSLLDEGIGVDPASAEAVLYTARVLWDHERTEDAVERLRAGLRRMPRDVSLLETTLDCLLVAGAEEEALATARAAVERDPSSATVWHLLAETMNKADSLTDVREIERAARKALALNERMYDAADLLSLVLTARGRTDEARTVIEEIRPKLRDPTAARGRLAWIQYTRGEAHAAVKAMASILADQPHYTWGWSNLITWIEGEEAWDEARRIFGEVPAALTADPEFQTRRLTLLAKAGADEVELDPAWERLLVDYPENEFLHASRFDDLWERGEPEKAAALLEVLRRFHPRSPHMLARWALVASVGGRREEAVETALKIWRMPGDAEPWSMDTSWEAIERVKGRRDTIEGATRLLLEGTRLNHHALKILVANARWIPVRLGFWRFLRYAYVSLARAQSVHGLRHLLDVLDTHPEEKGHGIAMALDQLQLHGALPYAYAWWEAHLESCRRRTPVWQAVGELLGLGDLKRQRARRDWLADWRERPDVAMWAVAIYTTSLRAHGGWPGLGEDLLEIHRSSGEALERLAHDNTAAYLACVRCEMSLRIRGDDLFLNEIDRLEPICDVDLSMCWFPTGAAFLPFVLPRFRDLIRKVRALTPGDRKAASRLRREERSRLIRLARDEGLKYPDWVKFEWRTRLPHR